ncbi:MAG: hypothetical protein KF749_04295 [Bacteroidetes bacterium]|nr:hypothetical protein [Bacteroidota bacterium]MCW5897597.1 hypothetical protein [Bacteroidota bacterium]
MTITLDKFLAQRKLLRNEKVRMQSKKNSAGENQFGVRLVDIRKFAGMFCILSALICLTPAVYAQPDVRNDYPPMGLGMAVPKFYDNRVVYFYGNPNLEKPVSDHMPTDSLVFERRETGFEITSAPPWFVPAHLKLDYDILFLRVVSIHSDFVEVIVNELNGHTAFMDRFKSDLRYWPEFLLTINSVEPLFPQDYPVRIKPLSHASLVSTRYAFLKPLRISSQWMEVELLDENFQPQGKGWIQWQENGKILITYSLLS